MPLSFFTCTSSPRRYPRQFPSCTSRQFSPMRRQASNTPVSRREEVEQSIFIRPSITATFSCRPKRIGLRVWKKAKVEATLMARFHIVAALTTASVALLTTFYLISTLGLPELDFLQLKYDYGRPSILSSQQMPVEPPPEADALSDPHTQYLLAIGKADITG